MLPWKRSRGFMTLDDSCCAVLPQVSYGIGLPEPLSVYVDTYRTGKIPDEEIQEAVMRTFDFRPGLIIQVTHQHAGW